MAAVLKKRAVAEFTQVLQEEVKQQPPLKKLRLTYRPKNAELQLDLSKCSSAREAFQVLQALEETLPLAAERVQPTVAILLEHFHKESESCVRAKIANLLSKLCRAPVFNAAGLVDDVKNLLKNEKSDVVRSQLMVTLTSIGQAQCANSRLNKLLVECAVSRLDDCSHLVRWKSLDLIGLLGSSDHLIAGQKNSKTSVLSILESFTHEPDCRVRMHAFQAMLMWHQRGLQLGQSVYGQACLALTDDFEGVRLTAVKLVWVLGQLYPNATVNLPESSEPIRLVDDGFANICNMVNDISMTVRAESARLLGSLHAVSPRFLEQTLDKKLMSNMRRKRSAHERQKEFFESGEWSSGQKWGDDAPKEDLDPDNVSLISSGACGAFVHGLEDEYLEVRNATVDSLCELASHSPGFAKLSQDFLVDMFNDEIESVRLNAINSLRKICHHFLLREDQLEIILSVLKDFNFEIREAVRDMLSSCRLSTKACLNIIVTTLLDNMNRYSEDRQSIWKCMMNIGKHHSSLVLSMAPDLLSTHPFFESIEPDINDAAYTSILVLIFNAAIDCPTMTPLFPDYLTRHYTYLRDILPDLVPSLKFAGPAAQDIGSVVRSLSSGETLLSQILSRLEGLEFMDSASAVQLMKIAIRDLRQVDHLEPELSASAQCIVLHFKCQLYLEKAIMKSRSICSVLRLQHDKTLLTTLVQNVLDLTARMEYQFLGLGLADLVQIRQLCLMAMTLQLLCQLQDSATENKAAICKQYLHYLNRLQQLISRCGSTTNAFTDSLLSELPVLKSCEPERYPQILMSSLGLNKPSLLRLSNYLCKAHIELIEPSGTSDFTVKFIAGLAAPLNVVAFVNNVTHLDRLRIQVKYPDQQTHLILPPLSDFRQLTALRHKLVTKVLLSHVLWSEQCPVKLCVVMLCSSDDEEAVSDQKSTSSDAAVRVIELCNPVSVNVAPTACKKN